MGLALKQAEKAFANGEFPVGCVIVQDENVISTGARQGTAIDRSFVSEIDHAEIRALKNLETIKDQFDLTSFIHCDTLCFSLFYWNRLRESRHTHAALCAGISVHVRQPFLFPIFSRGVSGMLRQSVDLIVIIQVEDVRIEQS